MFLIYLFIAPVVLLVYRKICCGFPGGYCNADNTLTVVFHLTSLFIFFGEYGWFNVKISRNKNNTASTNVLNVESYFLHEAASRSRTRPHASLRLVTVARQRPKLLQAVINISASDWRSSVWDGHFVFSVTRSVARACSAECRYSLNVQMPAAFLSIASVRLM